MRERLSKAEQDRQFHLGYKMAFEEQSKRKILEEYLCPLAIRRQPWTQKSPILFWRLA